MKLTDIPINIEIKDAINPIIKNSCSHKNIIFFGLAPNILKIATSYSLSFLLTFKIPANTITPDSKVIKAIEFTIVINKFSIDLIAT